MPSSWICQAWHPGLLTVTWAKMNPSVELRYFPVLGRAQPLRDALYDAGIEFHDVFVSLDQWPGERRNTLLAGLPILRWGQDTVAETLAIANYLSRQLGHYVDRTPASIARLEAICSFVYLEVILRLGDILWSDVVFEGTTPETMAARLMPRMLSKLTFLESLVETKPFFGDKKPVLADFFVCEGIEALHFAFGARAAFEEQLPNLHALRACIVNRPRLDASKRPIALTARPDEDAIVQRLRGLPLRIDRSNSPQRG